mgnify:CR=1 FL=1
MAMSLFTPSDKIIAYRAVMGHCLMYCLFPDNIVSSNLLSQELSLVV